MPATGHKFEVSEVVAPTCEEKGYTVYVCTVCGDEKTDDFKDVVPHAYEVVETFEATCTENGYVIKVCADCKDEIKEKTDDKLGHSFENGVCTGCGAEEGLMSDLFYYNMLNSWKEVNGVAFKLDGLYVELNGLVVENNESVFKTQYPFLRRIPYRLLR